MTTRKRASGLVLAAAAVMTVLWIGWRDGSASPTQITRIAALQEWPLGHGEVFSTEPHLWLSSHEIFHFNGDSIRGYPAVTYDVLTHSEHPEPGLAVVSAGHVVSASPDGQWVLWNTQKFENSNPGMAATRRSDGKTIHWPFVQPDRSEGFWMPDSRRWICITYIPTGKTIHGHTISEKRLVVYSVNHPGFQSFTIPMDTGIENILGVTPQGKVIINDSFDQSSGASGQPHPPLSLEEVSLDGPQPSARAFQVQVPSTSSGNGGRTALSPQGDRLLWSCFSGSPNSIPAWIGSLVHGRESQDIWTCGLDGSAPHHAGIWSNRQVGFTVDWNPDGKHISLTMNGTLYLASVP